MIDINSYFDEHFYDFDDESIYRFNEQDNGPINNVITRLNERCYGVLIYDEREHIEFMLLYIDSTKKLTGLGLLLSLNLELYERTILSIEFCKLISNRFPELDVVESFNTFQTQCRGTFEKMGFITFGSETNNLPKGTMFIKTAGSKGLLTFPTLDKLEVYRWFFNEDAKSVKVDESKIKKVYLLLDSTNNLIKIGESFYPKKREKTLQGINPSWDLITTWIAPVSEERRLHKLFSEKRTRGEWFNLNFNDLAIIRKEMSGYKNCL
ncbi:GIY-YIG nuclease family protein [Tenacibaculum sp. SDUM215027]|uniref:GIY-YIG nuclease family protein n=1 Tax=Tenacibaculum sp. SDUM215027 TaxID=3422596 RepID=UPI003D31EA79